MTSDVVRWEEQSNLIDEPGSSGHPTITAQPKFRQVRVALIAGLKVDLEKVDWVEDRRPFFEDYR